MQVTPLGPPKLLEKMSEVLSAAGDPLDRGHASSRLREALLPHLDPQEIASLDALMRRLDTLCDAVVAKAGFPLTSRLCPAVISPLTDAYGSNPQAIFAWRVRNVSDSNGKI